MTLINRNLNLAVIAQLIGVWLVASHGLPRVVLVLGIAVFVYGACLYRRSLRELRQAHPAR